jgi:Sec-independent protein translocase protein TatA
MEILGIGMPELIFILIIALLVLGPKDLEKTGRTIGSWLNQMVRSDTWKTLTNVSREMRTLPNRLMREANLDAIKGQVTAPLGSDKPARVKTPPRSQPLSADPAASDEHQIAPENVTHKENEDGQTENG